MKCHPKLSVVMPVYNASKYLPVAIDSILKQTFTDYEFIIIDDGSKDGSWKIINSFIDPRIVAIRNSRNRGITYSLNKGIKIATGDYIARMDGDDYSYPKRFETQLKFLKSNPRVDLVGSNIRMIDDNKVISKTAYPTSHNTIKASLLFGCPIAHPTVTTKAKILKKYLYDEDYLFAEDFELWSRVANEIRFANLGTILLDYRIHNENSLTNLKTQQLSSFKVMTHMIRKLGIKNENIDVENHKLLVAYKTLSSHKEFISMINWCSKIIYQNKSVHFYDNSALKQMLCLRSIHILRTSSMSNFQKFAHLLDSFTLLS